MNDLKLFNESKNKPEIRELTLVNGISYPSDQELIMLILGKGTKQLPIEKLSYKVMDALDCKESDQLKELLKIPGIGKTKALSILASIELGRRKAGHLRALISTPQDVIPFLKHYTMKKTEHFITVTLTGAREILSIKVISIGTINRTIIHPREIFAGAVEEHASGIICCHNHPFGACQPSPQDIESTKALKQASEILGITFLDHLIITRDNYFSFSEHHML